MYVTAVLGLLDLETGDLSFAAAGHEPPILVPDAGAPESIQAEGGPVLGLLPAKGYPVNALRLSPGEAVVLFTDGVSEAADAAGEFFGPERLVDTLRGAAHAETPAITDGVLSAVRAFAGAAPQSDDITILTLRYRPVSPTP